MASFSLLTLLVALRLLLLVSGAPAPQSSTAASTSSSSYWVSSITRQGTVAFGDSSFKIFRNVKDYGAVGDGSTDDTAAINKAITDGSRCGQGCDSSTVTPALVYFPPGTYAISAPLVQLYYTQFVGDAVTVPTIKALASFKGIAMIDANPYDNSGNNWYTNQNNFFRQVRNFVLDMTAMPASAGAGIHWQVAQATSLQNIVFNMRTDGGTANAQQGIFMDNGSGGFMTDLTFNGGKYGAFFGNQQFTTRNLTFNGCQTAIFMNWNWAWTLQGITINNANIGIDMANGGASAQTVGSVLLLDSTISNTPIGVSTVYTTSATSTNGTLIMENVDMSTNVPVAVADAGTKATILAGNAKVASWSQGRGYSAATVGKAVQASETAVTKPATLLNSAGRVYTRSKPQYETEAASAFISVKSNGAKGDGTTDDTAAIQAIFDKATNGSIVYFDHGAYLVTSTVKVPKDIKITGEMWPLIMAGGSTSFSDQANPKAVFQVGQPGDTGSVEMSDLVFETVGPQPGAILMEWNVKEASQGSAGMWDVHFRIGGSAGTQLQSDKCAKNPNVTAAANPSCEGAFMLLHVTNQSSIYLENNWFWVSDHELDLTDHNQINIFNGRGVLIASEAGPVWMYGTSSEHSVLYNYQISNAANVYMALIQTETPYYQSNPGATTPFTVNAAYNDPDFSKCTGTGCDKAWGLRIVGSKDVFVYGAGLYSFFDNYDQTCLETESCQENIMSIENSGSVYMFGLSTKASVNMLTVDGKSAALDSDNRNNFCATLAFFAEAGNGTTTQSTGSQPAGSQSSGTPSSSSQLAGSKSSSTPSSSSQPAGSKSSGTPASSPQLASSKSSGTPSSNPQLVASQSLGSQPAATKPTGSQSAGSQPAATKSSSSQPAATKSTGSQSADFQPAGSQPAATKSSATQLSITKSSAVQAVVTQTVYAQCG
ncbi:glycoside hydrolase family 55 protein [Coleophoma crateriformis]|uniref:Glycoside hydrolase family 55 protein n=1 Tax=Coleophoma crateriformis TaxID=565419 RepID=A0A3D8SAA9_9HELO|nr:glycoside hydrolase family 55 protein [Coleophoma crateriformis]